MSEVCATCRWWIRQPDLAGRFGVCAHPTKDPIPVRVHQAFTCSSWTAKVEKAEKSGVGNG